jgi:transitional endoplasmic reticulum ATPase
VKQKPITKMKNPLFKTTINKSAAIPAITRAVIMQLGTPSASFISTVFSIEKDGRRWHGKVTESKNPDVQIALPEDVAKALSVSDGDQVELSISILSQANYLQLQVSEKASEPTPLIPGVEITKDVLVSYDRKPSIVLSVSPAGKPVYFAADTEVEVLEIAGETGSVTKRTAVKTKKPLAGMPSLSGIIGNEALKDEVLGKVLLPIREFNRAKHFMPELPKGFILAGPPGTGKTTFMKLVAEEAGLPFLQPELYELLDPVVFDRTIRKFADDNPNGGLIFIDEADRYFPHKEDYNERANIMTSVFQSFLDGFESNHRCLSVLATNYPGDIAGPVLRSGRVDMHFNLKAPNLDERKRILELHSKDLNIGVINWEKLAAETAGFVGADLKRLIRDAGAIAFKRSFLSNTTELVGEVDLAETMAQITPTGSKILGGRRPIFNFDNMFGRDRLVNQLKEIVLNGANKDGFACLSILLEGPPGNGKTMIAEAIAEFANVYFVPENVSAFESKYVGETQENIRKLFANARNFAPLVVLLDEIDALGAKRSELSSDYRRSATNALLSEIDNRGGQNTNIIIVGTTNQANVLDDALLSRFQHVIRVPNPSEAEIMAYLGHKFDGHSVDVETLAARFSGRSYRDLEAITDYVLRENRKGAVANITAEFIEFIAGRGKAA